MTGWHPRHIGAVAAIALLGAGAGSAAAEPYEPFKTDFPKGVAPREPYRPFATDFGIAARPAGGTVVLLAKSSQSAVSARGLEWQDVGLGAGAGLGLAALAATGVLAVRTRRHHAPGKVGASLGAAK